jgi:very-short-patch-repair endonuclease
MNPESAPPPVDRRLAALADRQYGVVTRAQLRRLGIGDTGIRERVRTHRLRRLHRGVYALGHTALRPEAYWLAAVLACGDGAVLSHVSAAEHWNVWRSATARIDVTVPSRAGRPRRSGIRIHRSRRLGPKDVTVHEGIPVTTLARTLIDLADVLPKQVLKRAIDEADYHRLLDMTSLLAAVHRNPGRRGAKVVALAQAPPERTRSGFERRFLAAIERHGLPRPKVAVPVEGYEADFLWPEARLVVETDGFGAHGTRRAFEHDRRRDRLLARAGYRTVRLTELALRDEEAEVVAALRDLLTRAPAGARWH